MEKGIFCIYIILYSSLQIANKRTRTRGEPRTDRLQTGRRCIIFVNALMLKYHCRSNPIITVNPICNLINGIIFFILTDIIFFSVIMCKCMIMILK